ncbi:AmiS/UreI family transporter [Niallia nealsonii]|uniref:Urease accessory protein UreI n=1 Tax=Niallia nealsonii TaxID=115979 RepID=A0A2N0Z5D0_9BACI|nr:AmiS/UreI family transporter [Niallia nealsonii]PKG24710.1 urease accessory protein UreI [Niallia nealsonii]
MDQIGLLLSGAALFLNGLMLLGKADEKNVGIYNLFVGAFQVIAPFYLIITSDQNNWVLYEKSAIFLFGFTYLYVGVTVLKGMKGTGLGYYSLWVSIIGLVYVTVSFVRYQDINNAITWILWSFLWFLFFVLNTSKKDVSKFVGKVAIVQSWVTLTLPALFSLTGVWRSIYNIWSVVLILTILYFVCTTFSNFLLDRRKQFNVKQI